MDLVAWGADDSTGPSGHIVVGGKTIVDLTYAGRGFFIAVVNLATCSASGYTNYDTYESADVATILAQYLQGLAAGTVIVGGTADSANDESGANLEPVALLAYSLSLL